MTREQIDEKDQGSVRTLERAELEQLIAKLNQQRDFWKRRERSARSQGAHAYSDALGGEMTHGLPGLVRAQQNTGIY